MVHVRALPLEFDLRMIRNSIVKCNPIQVPMANHAFEGVFTCVEKGYFGIKARK